MKIWIRTAAAMLVVLVMFPGLASAQAAKIGFVNVSRLLAESPQAKAAMETLRQEFEPRQREIVARQDSFKARQEQVQRDLEVMGAEERRNAERDLRKAEREITRSQDEFNEDFNLRRNEQLGRLQRELMEQVQAFARESGYDLIVGEGVLYASQAIDVTPQILKGLEASFERPAAAP